LSWCLLFIINSTLPGLLSHTHNPVFWSLHRLPPQITRLCLCLYPCACVYFVTLHPRAFHCSPPICPSISPGRPPHTANNLQVYSRSTLVTHRRAPNSDIFLFWPTRQWWHHISTSSLISQRAMSQTATRTPFCKPESKTSAAHDGWYTHLRPQARETPAVYRLPACLPVTTSSILISAGGGEVPFEQYHLIWGNGKYTFLWTTLVFTSNLCSISLRVCQRAIWGML